MLMYPSRGSYNFLGLENADVEEADVVIFPVPYDATASYKSGSRFGPRAIIWATNEVEAFDLDLKKDLSKFKFCTLEELEPDVSSPKAMVNLVANIASHIATKKKFFVLLGGEHTVTVGSVMALAKQYKDLTVLSLDAHADLRQSYQNSEYSHACTMRRCLEHCKNVMWVGVRSMSEEEYNFAKQNGLKIYEKIDADKILKECSKNVYVTLDVDVLDPSIMPGTGTPVPCGLSVQEVLYLLKRVFEEKNVVASDMVELIPDGISEDVGATLLTKVIAYKLCLRH
jgi:agmatinase